MVHVAIINDIYTKLYSAPKKIYQRSPLRKILRPRSKRNMFFDYDNNNDSGGKNVIFNFLTRQIDEMINQR